MEYDIRKYIELVHFLGGVLPKHYEVVLQDVESRSIVAIENGQVSGRQIGSPMTDYSLRVIADGSWRDKPYEINYEGNTADGRPLRSSTWFIESAGELKAMLCINVDLKKYEAVCGEILALGGITPGMIIQAGEKRGKAIEQFHNSLGDMIASVISEMTVGVPLERLMQEERVAIITELDKRGLFLIKGAVSEVAQQLGCSEASVYRYLSLARQHS